MLAVAVTCPLLRRTVVAAELSDRLAGRGLELVRGRRMRVRQFPVARHARVVRAGRPGPVRGDLRAQVQERVGHPLDIDHLRSDVLRGGYDLFADDQQCAIPKAAVPLLFRTRNVSPSPSPRSRCVDFVARTLTKSKVFEHESREIP